MTKFIILQIAGGGPQQHCTRYIIATVIIIATLQSLPKYSSMPKHRFCRIDARARLPLKENATRSTQNNRETATKSPTRETFYIDP